MKYSPYYLSKGYSLIELMVAMALGLLLIAAVLSVFIGFTQTNKQFDGRAQITDSARIVFDYLRRDFAQVGFVDMADPAISRWFFSEVGDDTQTNIYLQNASRTLVAPLERLWPGMWPVFGCDGAISNTPSALAEPATFAPSVARASLTCSSSNDPLNAVLQIAYQARRISANASLSALTTTGVSKDCGQFELSTRFIAINQYYLVAKNGEKTKTFTCKGPSGKEVGLAEGIQEFALRYMMNRGSMNWPLPGDAGYRGQGAELSQGYLRQSNVNGSQAASNWPRVSAVEVCIIAAEAAPDAKTGNTDVAQLQTSRPTCARDDTTGQFSANIAREKGDQRTYYRYVQMFVIDNAIFSND
jgi:type IV pilus assembly protein PilW